MPKVADVGGIAIRFYYDDHEPPHLHAKTSTFEAKVHLGTLDVMESSGSLRPSDLRRIRAWASQHQSDLFHIWTCAREKKRLPNLGVFP